MFRARFFGRPAIAAIMRQRCHLSALINLPIVEKPVTRLAPVRA
jgi:hypothetical protein